jgi:hypothetical protein
VVSHSQILTSSQRKSGAITTELIVAMSILAVAMIPLTYSFVQEQKLCRAYYYRAVVMEILDGELEVIVAGEWRSFKEGSHAYRVSSDAAHNLPAGHFALTLVKDTAKLEWLPEKPGSGKSVSREARVR